MKEFKVSVQIPTLGFEENNRKHLTPYFFSKLK
jgi:hypothetical protein